MLAIGIDAAWTSKNPSGVAAVLHDGTAWRCIAGAPSYGDFVARARGATVGTATLAEVLAAARSMAGGREIAVVALDIPLAIDEITGRREADRAISRTFGDRKCSAHSPTPERPGPISTGVREALAVAGLPLATNIRRVPAAIEVYPHPALLTLLGASERVPYKKGKQRDYWREASPVERRTRLIAIWRTIAAALAKHLGPLPFSIPGAPRARDLKSIEDELDAWICAWIATRYLEERAVPYGDQRAAVWCPT